MQIIIFILYVTCRCRALCRCRRWLCRATPHMRLCAVRFLTVWVLRPTTVWCIDRVGSEGPSNVETQIQENSNYFVILSSRMKPWNKIIWYHYENNVTYRVQLFEKIFILWDNSSSITVQFGEYCCQSKMYKSGICGFSPFIETVRCTYSSCACSCLRISSRIFFCEFLANRMSSPILGLSTLK